MVAWLWCGEMVAQVGAGGEAFEVVDARQLFSVKFHVRETQQQLCDLRATASSRVLSPQSFKHRHARSTDGTQFK